MPEKQERGGEDAWIDSENYLAIADGVGSWDMVGINPANYSR